MVESHPQSIQGYQVLECIGQGGFGAVYRAKQATIEREVAIKFIVPERANQPDFIRRFELEAQIIARLEHPHIVPLIDYWRDPDGAYIVVRYLKGGSANDALKQEPFGLQAASKLLDQIASALAFAHRQEVIHRDIKPGNILLDEDGNAYLADFGIAKDLTFTGTGTHSDAIVGSLDYISPEQARGEAITARTDIYSLAVTLYELVVGEHPFKEFSSIERLYMHINDPLPLITQLPDTPETMLSEINEVIQKATQKDPQHRYDDVLAFAQAFREAVGIGSTQQDFSVLEQLTLREHEVLQLIGEGLSNRAIAENLFITIATVKWYVRQIYKKLGVRSRVQAIVRARELDLIIPGTATASDLPQVGTSGAAAVSLPEPENPYKGLAAFQASDARDFFGRDELAAKLLHKMQDGSTFERFLALVGPSGSGKSSLVRAGLIPALWKGDIPGSEKWFVVDMIPGQHPLDQLETALIRVSANHDSNLHEQLARDARGLVRVADIILPQDGSQLVVVIDQFEELFTLVTDEAARQHFLLLLHAAVTEKRSRVRVIVTLRADYYDKPLHYAEVGEMLRARMETLLPLGAKGLERAIRGPAERVGVSFEPGLVEQMVSEMTYQAGALPLLQYALTELFEQREGRLLTNQAYQDIGGAVGALAKRAETLYVAFAPDQQALTQQMFLRLVTLGEGAEDTRRRATREELLAVADDAERADEIIDTFVDNRLLSLDHDEATRQPLVEVAHEALLREWERLRTWLNASREDIRQQRVVARAAEEWHKQWRDASYLLHGNRLEQVERWQDTTTLVLTPLEREFIAACIQQRDDERRVEGERRARERRLEGRSRVALIALVIVFAVAGAIAGGFAVSAQSSFIRAERIRLAAQAQIALNDGEDARIPALLALRSLELDYSADADAALLTALDRGFSQQRYVGHSGDGIMDVKFSPDGRHVLTATSDRTTRLWDALSGQELQRFTGHEDVINAVSFLPVGDTILTSSLDGTVRQWDVSTGSEQRRIINQDEPLRWLDVSPDGRYLAVIAGLDTIQIWDIAAGDMLRQLQGHEGQIATAVFSPDGQYLASASHDRTIALWEVATGEEIRRFEGHVARVLGAVFSPDGQQLVSGGQDATIRLWDVATGELIDRFVTSGPVNDVAFSSDGSFIASAGPQDRVVRLWDVATGEEIEQLRGSTSGVGLVEISPDDRYVVSGGLGNVPHLWEVDVEYEPRTLELPFSAAHEEAVQLAALSMDETQAVVVLAGGRAQVWDVQERAVTFEFRVADAVFVSDAELLRHKHQVLTSDVNGHVRLWDLDTGELLQEYMGHESKVNALALSGTGNLLASAGEDHAAVLWDVTSGQIRQRLIGHQAPVTDVAISADHQHIATTSEDGSVRIWDANTGQEIRQIVGHNANVLAVAYSPDGRWIATGGDDNSAILWDASTGEQQRTLSGHAGGVRSVGFSPDSQWVVTGSQDQSARLWDAETGAVLRNFVGHRFPVRTLSFSQDASTLLTGDLSNTYLWRTQLDDVIKLVCQQISGDFSAEERSLYEINDNSHVCM